MKVNNLQIEVSITDDQPGINEVFLNPDREWGPLGWVYVAGLTSPVICSDSPAALRRIAATLEEAATQLSASLDIRAAREINNQAGAA